MATFGVRLGCESRKKAIGFDVTAKQIAIGFSVNCETDSSPQKGTVNSDSSNGATVNWDNRLE